MVKIGEMADRSCPDPTTPGEIEAAEIKGVSITINDNGVMDAGIQLACQSGSENFHSSDVRGFIRGVMETLEVSSWDLVLGRIVRVEHRGSCVQRIGHRRKDKWYPKRE
jgi:hypothetical protein